MAGETSLTKRIIFWSILVLVIVGLVELAAMIACHKLIPTRLRNRATYHSAEDYIGGAAASHREPSRRLQSASSVTESASEPLKTPQIYHPVLGWDYPVNARYSDRAGVSYSHGMAGERRLCTEFDGTQIASYGDSFTYCYEVGDCETWQTYLGRLLGTNVLNFGVSGYGTDQAYLKYRMNSAKAKTPVVILGILPDDINRVVNILRSFYELQDPVALTKPLFVREGDSYKLIPNPVAKSDDLKKLSDPEFVRRLGQYDYWYLSDMKTPSLGFPYLISLVRWRRTIAQYLMFDLSLNQPGSGRPYYPGNLFEEPGPLGVMCHIVDLFVETAQRRGATPIIVIMPHKALVEEFMQHGVNRVAGLLKHLEGRGYRYFDLITALAERKPSEKDLGAWFTVHATADGNKVIAKLIADYLTSSGALVSSERK